MHYYQFNIGDYSSHTRHLTPMEDLAYRRLLDLYYLHERPFVGSSTDVARMIGLREQQADVDSVLREFFTHDEAIGWVSERCEVEIAEVRDRREKAAKAGRASGKQRRGTVNGRSPVVQQKGNAVVERNGNDLRTNVEPPFPFPFPTPSLRERDAVPAPDPSDPIPPASGESPEPTGKPRKPKVVVDWNYPCPEDCDPSVWPDFLSIRKAKNLPLTKLAIERMQTQGEADGLCLDSVIRHCVERGHAGYYPDKDNQPTRRNGR